MADPFKQLEAQSADPFAALEAAQSTRASDPFAGLEKKKPTILDLPSRVLEDIKASEVIPPVLRALAHVGRTPVLPGGIEAVSGEFQAEEGRLRELLPTERLPGRVPRTGTEAILSSAIRRLPAAPLITAATLPVAAATAALPPALGIIAATTAAAGTEGFIGSVAEQSQEGQVSLTRAVDEGLTGLMFGPLVSVLPLGIHGARAAIKARRHAKLLASLEGASVPISEASPAPATTQTLTQGLEQMQIAEAKMRARLGKLGEAQDLRVSKLGKLSTRESQAIDGLSQRAAQTESRTSARIQKLDEQIATLENDPTAATRLGEKQSILDAERLTLLDKLEELRLEPTPLEAQFSRIKAIESRLLDISEESSDLQLGANLAHLDKNVVIGKLKQRQLQIIQAGQKELEHTSGNLIKKQKKLVAQKDQIWDRILEKQAPDSEFDRLTKELQDNLDKQVLIQDAQKKFKFITPTTGVTQDVFSANPIEEAVSRALRQVDKVDQLLEKGVISDTTAEVLRKAEFNNALAIQGINADKVTGLKPVPLNGWLDPLTEWSLFQRKSGIRTGEFAEKAAQQTEALKVFGAQQLDRALEARQALTKLGFSKDEISRHLLYFEFDGTFNPTAAKITDPSGKVKLDIPQYTGVFEVNPELLKQAQPLFAALRQQLTELGEIAGIPLLPRFLPLRKLSRPGTPQASLSGISDPTFQQARTSGALIPGVHETDFDTLFIQYVREVGRARTLGPVLEDGLRILNTLQLAGRTGEISKFRKYLGQVLGVSDETQMAQLFGERIYKLNKQSVDEILKFAPDPEAALTELSEAAKRASYSNLVGINPISNALNYFQPEMTLAVETSQKAVQTTKIALLVDKKLSQEVNGLLKFTLADGIESLQEVINRAPKSAAARALNFINIPSEFISKHIMGKIERRNRRLALATGLRVWNSGNKEELLSRLTVGQQSFIRSAFLQGGDQAARQAYAIILSNRSNFIYNVANKPEVLMGKLGRQIPFTTYARGILSRGIEDLVSGKYKQFAKRVALPLTMLTLYGMLTGEELEGQDPVSTVLGLARPSIAPHISAPLEAVRKRSLGAGIERGADILVGPYAIGKKAVKLYNKLAR